MIEEFEGPNVVYQWGGEPITLPLAGALARRDDLLAEAYAVSVGISGVEDAYLDAPKVSDGSPATA